MIHIAYFFPLNLGKYTGTKSPTIPFQLKYASLICGAAKFDIL